MLAASPLVRQSGFVSSDAHLLANLAMPCRGTTCTAATPPFDGLRLALRQRESASFCAVVSFCRAARALRQRRGRRSWKGLPSSSACSSSSGRRRRPPGRLCVLGADARRVGQGIVHDAVRVHWAVAVTNPPVTSRARLAVYEISPLWTDVVAARQPLGTESVPPMHGTGLLMTCGDAVGRRQRERTAGERAYVRRVLRLLERRSIEDLLTVLDGPDDPGDAVRAERLNGRSRRRPESSPADPHARRSRAGTASDDHDCRRTGRASLRM